VAAICPVLYERGLDSCTIQRSLEGELKAILAQCLPAERMVYSESVTQHFENCGSNKVRIFLAAELMGKMKLPNYCADAIEL
jgi:hypothetical protein